MSEVDTSIVTVEQSHDEPVGEPSVTEKHEAKPAEPTSETAVPVQADLKLEDLQNTKEETSKRNGTTLPTHPKTSVKAAAAKLNGSASGGVKKIINSGTYGSVKHPAVTKPPHPPVLRKSVSASAKPPMSSSASAKPSTTAGATRRTSAAPTTATKVTPAASKSSATTLRPSAATKPAPSHVPRPRASVTEGVKKVASPARPRLSSTPSKPTAVHSASATRISSTAHRVSRPTASISSIKEVKEDMKVVEELQGKLKDAIDELTAKSDVVTSLQAKVTEATSALESKASTVTSLEGELAAIRASLDTATGDLQEKADAISGLETKVQEAELALSSLKEEAEVSSSSDTELTSVKQELETAHTQAAEQSTVIESLGSKIQNLEEELKTAKEALQALEVEQSTSASDAADAAASKHAALEKAQSELASAQSEIEALKSSHGLALEDITAKLTVAESKVIGFDKLEGEFGSLKKEKEENASRVSELEVEILEFQERQEIVEDERTKTLAEIKNLEEQLKIAGAATSDAVAAAAAKEDKLNADASAATVKAAEIQAALNEQIETLKKELETILASHEQTKADAESAANEHETRFNAAEASHIAKFTEISGQLEKVTADLESQETQYNAKVEVVKQEHSKLLEEAFDRAKREASEAHSSDLHTLRSKSDDTMKQIQAANQSSLESLKAEHAAALESQAGELQKILSQTTLELKATSEDLTKTKASLEANKTTILDLETQLESARSAAEAAAQPSPEQIAEVEQLKQALSTSKDDLNALTEMLNITKTSLAEMSELRQQDIEESAKSHAAEVFKLKETHDSEVSQLAGQKAELFTKLSDMEGEVTTLKASLNAEPVAPKSNGAPPPQSPGISKEDLEKLHEAHNLKMQDLQASHDHEIRDLKEQLEVVMVKAEKLEADIGHKAMEIKFLEDDQDEKADEIKQLQADIEVLKEKATS